MKKLYRFFIQILIIICLFNKVIGSSMEAPLKNLDQTFPSTQNFKTHLKPDSTKFHSSKQNSNKLNKSNTLFVNTKPSFYHKYLLSTLGSRPNNSTIKLDTTSYPLTTNLYNIQVSTPIHDAMTLSYSLLQDNLVTVKLFSVLGNEITTLFSERQNSGPQIKTFYISDKVSSGIYILRLTVGTQRIAKRIQVL